MSWYSKVVCAAVFGFASVQPAAAQSSTPNVAFGYSFLRLLGDADYTLPAGWLVSFAGPVKGTPVALVGEVAGNYRRDDGVTVRLHTAQGGIRFSGDTDGGVTPFAQMLLGIAAFGCCGGSDKSFVIEPGGGVDFPLNRSVSMRVAASLPIAFSDGDSAHGIRLQAGVVLPFATR